MTVTVKKVELTGKLKVTNGNSHTFRDDSFAKVTMTKDGSPLVCLFRIEPGFKTDGASVPALLQWFLPSWEDNFIDDYVDGADIYNVGSCIHDGLYIKKGFGLFTREECDDILRGIWRESGISRFKAGVADKCIEWFAGGKKHWGNDSYGVSIFFHMDEQ